MTGTTRYLPPGRLSRAINRVVAALTRRGLSLWGSRILSVAGRTTGIMRSTPVNVLAFDDEQYLVAARGNTQWVRNVRADPKVRLGSAEYLATEVPVPQRAPVIAAYRPLAGKVVEGYFRDLPDDADHPVFALTPAG